MFGSVTITLWTIFYTYKPPKPVYWKFVQNIFLIKNCNLPILRPPNKGRPTYRRSLQPSEENIKHFKTWNFSTFFRIFESFLPFWIRILIPDPDPLIWLNPDRIQNTGVGCRGGVQWGGDLLPSPQREVGQLRLLLRLQTYRAWKVSFSVIFC